jgi:chromate transporter
MTPTSDLYRTFGKIGLLSFGGPAAQIALMHKTLVDDRKWLSEKEFLRALSFCMLLPGPEAMQLATYAGWKLRGIPGGLIAGGLFVLPGACVIFALALLYARFGDVPFVQAGFLGIKAAVVVIVIEAILKIGKRALKGAVHWAIAGLAFVALFAFQLPFPLVIGGAALLGALVLPTAIPEATLPLRMAPSLRIAALGGVLWALPILLAAAFGQIFLVEIGIFFSKLAVVTFGGAYSVLAYMTQEVVQQHGWIDTATMLDALGLAETTPGPLILVTQFVAILAGFGQGGTALAILAGLMTLWVTFVPCFIWIFAGAPLMDWLGGKPRLSSALAGLTAAVVGVIASISVWFALHVVFATVGTLSVGAITLPAPDFASLSISALALTLLAAILILWQKVPLLPALLAMMAAGLSVGAITG